MMRHLILLATLVATSAAADEAFTFSVMDVFGVSGGDVEIVISGKVESGTVSVGDTVCLHSKQAGDVEVTVAGIESFRKLLTSAKAGEMVGIGVNGIGKDAVSRGDTLSASCGE